jgi:uncharacterized coiled-coil protein SlyX
MKNRNHIFAAILVEIACFAFLPMARAVVPAPDGGYPGGNTAEGQNALLSRTTGIYNTAVGIYSLLSLTDGQFCTAVGAGTLLSNNGGENTATGAGALLSNNNGEDNTAIGAFALFSNVDGFDNTAVGDRALFSNTTLGIDNTAIGHLALENNTTGAGNTAIGNNTLVNTISGNLNTALGANAGNSVTTASNVICIGASGADVDNSCYVGNIFGQPIDPATATLVAVDSSGKLGTMLSSRRFKHDIKPMDKASEAILALNPVTFHYKSDAKSTPCFGLIAEEVAQVNPDLVLRDKNGEVLTVRYDAVNAMLLNEFLKEHKAFLEEQCKVQEQERTIGGLESAAVKQEATITALESKAAKQEEIIAQQQREMRTVMARLNDQAAQIQKVSAQIEASRSVTKVAEASQ